MSIIELSENESITLTLNGVVSIYRDNKMYLVCRLNGVLLAFEVIKISSRVKLFKREKSISEIRSNFHQESLL